MIEPRDDSLHHGGFFRVGKCRLSSAKDAAFAERKATMRQSSSCDLFRRSVLEFFEFHPDLRTVADFDLQAVHVTGTDAALADPLPLQVEQRPVGGVKKTLLPLHRAVFRPARATGRQELHQSP